MKLFQKTRVLSESVAIEARLLEKFGVTRSELLSIVHAVVAARNEVVDNDPKNAAGWFKYSYGVRALRNVFLKKDGWVKHTENGIEMVYNQQRGIKIMYQNSDNAASDMEPKAICGKGPASERIVELSNRPRYLFPEFEEEDKKELDCLLKLERAEAWFLFISINDNGEVKAELSCPSSIKNAQFGEFNERILFLKDGEFDLINPKKEEDDTSEQEFEIEVTRKME